jgi:hypothetical protein
MQKILILQISDPWFRPLSNSHGMTQWGFKHQWRPPCCEKKPLTLLVFIKKCFLTIENRSTGSTYIKARELLNFCSSVMYSVNPENQKLIELNNTQGVSIYAKSAI